jgi:hypothetical protein
MHGCKDTIAKNVRGNDAHYNIAKKRPVSLLNAIFGDYFRYNRTDQAPSVPARGSRKNRRPLGKSRTLGTIWALLIVEMKT